MADQNVVTSICMITYNHENYIKKAIEGVLFQKANFKYKLIISDDFSQDKTRKICLDYKEKYPNKIDLLLPKTNLGMMGNFLFALGRCSGKFIALCEGDDYWTDTYKLQKQVDFMEANQHISLCYHPVNVLFPDGQIEEDYIIKGIMEKQESNIYDLATLGNYIHTPSVLFRNVVRDFPSEFIDSPIGDFFIYMLLGQYGNFYRLADNMAVYRHGVGTHSTQDNQERTKRWIKTLSLIKDSIGDPTIKKILELRINPTRIQMLPKILRQSTDLWDINKAEKLVTYVSFSELLKALLKKMLP